MAGGSLLQPRARSDAHPLSVQARAHLAVPNHKPERGLRGSNTIGAGRQRAEVAHGDGVGARRRLRRVECGAVRDLRISARRARKDEQSTRCCASSGEELHAVAKSE
jgi:hypothetical protein